MTHRFRLSPDFIRRLAAYRDSAIFRDQPTFAKSEYWQYFSALIRMEIEGEEVLVSGASGNYIPREDSWRSRLRGHLVSIHRRLVPRRIRLLGFREAFDAVMSQDPIADLDDSPQRLDFRELKKRPGVFSSVRELRKNFFGRGKYFLGDEIARAYYLYDVLVGYLGQSQVRSVLEIGAGNGNLAAAVRYHLGARITIVDLPETLCLSLVFLADLFPEAKILMPHEARDPGVPYDLVFLTPGQIQSIPDDSFDVAINVESFQEMTPTQIGEYFQLVQRTCHRGGHFLSLNRVEKIPASTKSRAGGMAVNRFSEYPWNPANRTIVHEICRANRLAQLDAAFLRLERVGE